MVELASIQELIEELQAGRPIVVADDENRENEGDLFLAAEFATAEQVNFLRKEAGGLLCLAMTEERCDELGLPPMVVDNEAPLETGFTVTIEAREGVTTGISAADMARTISVAIDPQTTKRDLVRPGHVFPLRSKDGGVLVRTGHTEAVVDLCRLGDLQPAGLVCEIMNEDGSMARMPELEVYAKKHGLKLGTIADLVEYRRRRERIIERLPVVQMPTEQGYFDLYPYKSIVDDRVHCVLVHGIERLKDENGRFAPIEEPVLVRVHSECLTGDAFLSQRCDCGPQLHAAMEAVQKVDKGIVLYIRQEGRGIGLEHKLKAYQLQEQGFDTVEANIELGFPADKREYGTGAQILHDLGVRKMRLITNNPKKLSALNGYGLEIVEQVPLHVGHNEHNARYLATKRDKMGHTL